MAINYVISYTFSPGTTISSSQVNTNFSDNANTWNGLEALTKSFAALRVDATPTAATDVSIKSYVDKLNAYRRPVLQWGSVTTVAVESGLDGTSGDIPLLFPDGTLRTETSTTRTTFDITRNCVLSGTAQSGLRAALSEGTNTWYALYGVKVTDTSSTWVTVGDTLLPIRANFSTLNSNFGINGWVYLGLIGNGDNSGATGDIMKFYMVGNRTIFYNTTAGNVASGSGPRLATTASATSLTFTYAAGTNIATPQIPNNVTIGLYLGTHQNGANTENILGSSGTYNLFSYKASAGIFGCFLVEHPVAEGLQIVSGGAEGHDIFLRGFVDGVLGIGANPLL